MWKNKIRKQCKSRNVHLFVLYEISLDWCLYNDIFKGIDNSKSVECTIIEQFFSSFLCQLIHMSDTRRFQIHFVTNYIVYQRLFNILHCSTRKKNHLKCTLSFTLYLTVALYHFQFKVEQLKYFRIIWKHKPKAQVFLVEEFDGNFQCHGFNSKSKIQISTKSNLIIYVFIILSFIRF